MRCLSHFLIKRNLYLKSNHAKAGMKTIPELKEVVLQREQRRLAMGKDIGTIRADVRNIEQLHFEAKCFGFSIDTDEPPERGGTHTALDPLGYFIIGAASCFLTQVAREIMIRNLNIDTMEITARAHYDVARTREFSDMIYDLRLTGNETPEKTIELLHAAENRCFPHRTLSKAIPLTTNLSLNGTTITSHTMGPSDSPVQRAQTASTPGS